MNSANHSEASPSDGHPFAWSRLWGREANPAMQLQCQKARRWGSHAETGGGVGNTEELAFAPCTPSLTLPLPLAVYNRIIFPISQVKKVRHHWGKLPKSAGYCRKRWGRLAAELTAIGRASSEGYSLPTGASLYQKHPTVRVSVHGMCGGQVGSVASCKHVSVYPYN